MRQHGMPMSLETPVVFLIFKRPELTERVFAEIAKARPKRLFVVADAARSDVDGESDAVAATRAIIDRVDWPCKLMRNYASKNLGCKQRISSGLEWAFGHVEEAIILEDDCLPHASFFPFCEELLERYRDDDRIGTIRGSNFQNGRSRSEHGYFFSKYFDCWGWATWRRTWTTYDPEMRSWPAFESAGKLQEMAEFPPELSFWSWVFRRQFAGDIDSWAFPWQFSTFSQSQLAVVPDVNLVSNIGFGDCATHTSNHQHRLANLPTEALAKMEHPSAVVRDDYADQYAFFNRYGRAKGLRKLHIKFTDYLEFRSRAAA